MRFITVQSSERKKTDWRCTAVIKCNFIILTLCFCTEKDKKKLRNNLREFLAKKTRRATRFYTLQLKV